MLRTVLRGIGWLLLALIAILLLLRVAAWWREDGAAVPAGMAMVPTSYGKVAVRLSGPADGPRIVLVHGSAAWSGFWREVSAHLAARGWRVIAVDVPPFGYSERDPHGRYGRVSQAVRLGEVVQSTGGRAVVMGHSFGAGAATELALREPGLVERLVLVDAALGELDPPPGTGAGAVSNTLAFAPAGQAVTAATITNPALAGPILRTFLARKDTAKPWLDTLTRPMRREGSTAAYAQWLPTLVTRNDGARSRSRAALAAIAVPVRLVWGELDSVTPPDQARALQKLLGLPEVIWVRDAGHIPHIEQPANFLEALDRAIAPEPEG